MFSLSGKMSQNQTLKNSNGEIEEKRKYRILVLSVMAVGHVNACSGVAKHLLNRGHRVAFLVDPTYKGKLKSLGFEEFIFELKSVDIPADKNPGDDWADLLVKYNVLGESDNLQRLKNVSKLVMASEFGKRHIIDSNEAVKKVIEEFKPDLLIVDNPNLMPAIYHSKIPWIQIASGAPLFYHNFEDLPPGMSGFPIDSDKSKWIPFREELNKSFKRNKDFNDVIEEMGYERYPNDTTMPQGQELTVYAYPEEYNYPPLKNMENWFNIEVFNPKPSKGDVTIESLVPQEFFKDDLDGKFSGKWIYLSLGSMGAAYIKLMKRFVDILSKTNHKYIVSKGPRHTEYELARNMWGDRYLPQTDIIPLVDLVITHGGNNTVTETFAQGKPMIVVPLFGDQPDNAQRLHETGYGLKLEPYSFTEEELLEAVERGLNDKDLRERVEKASKRIQSSNKHELLCDKIEEIIKSWNLKTH